ncbi:uncharacterized protein LOC110345597 [Heterocephalus glaber]|uniref:Uncharacterized protein LOC110345597 n=1 Tax=Heterocephalus glaber TaxID=10181 RepID=A0AAX6RQW6_HETGA|nr:uncharacterized protein LOC110345597 [Heterocephalus glaber]XP_021099199.1 uncharacterized protein LOC110345597 [Heterocephalus glaber]
MTATKTLVQGATGTRDKMYPWTTSRTVDLGSHTMMHSFLVIPECHYPLLGWDLLGKLRATISFNEQDASLHLGMPSQSMVTCPLSEEYLLQPQGDPEVPEGDTKLIKEFQRLFPKVWAETNLPGLAAHQPPVVVTLLAAATPIAIKQYPIKTAAREKRRIHFRRLLDAEILRPSCKEVTKDFLELLQALGYRVSAKKAQICVTKTTYLGYQLSEGKRLLLNQRIQTILQIPTPTTKHQVREFLGSMGYCRLWILGFAEIEKPLYSATAWGGVPTPLDGEGRASLPRIKGALTGWGFSSVVPPRRTRYQKKKKKKRGPYFGLCSGASSHHKTFSPVCDRKGKNC